MFSILRTIYSILHNSWSAKSTVFNNAVSTAQDKQHQMMWGGNHNYR